MNAPRISKRTMTERFYLYLYFQLCVEVLMETTVNKDGEESSSSHPQIITKGTCICLSWSDQKVDMKTSPLSVDESSYDADDNTSNKVANSVSQRQITLKSY